MTAKLEPKAGLRYVDASIILLRGARLINNELLTDEQRMLNDVPRDAAAFELLYQRHKGGVYRYFLRHCSRADVAEELHHDIWIKLIKARESYQPTAKFTTWLYTQNHWNCS